MEIRIFDADFNFLGVIENHTSLIWTTRYYDVGEFELHVPLLPHNVFLLKPNNLVTKKGSETVGIVEDIQRIERYDQRKLIVKGRFLESVLDKRLIRNTFNFEGKVNDAIPQLIQNVKSIPLLNVRKNNKLNDTVIFQVTMKNLLNVIINLCKKVGYGFKIEPDFYLKRFYFSIYQGRNRTIEQSDNSRVIFSDEYDTIREITYNYNSTQFRNFAIVGGKGEGSSRVYVTVGDEDAEDLREIFVDAKGVQDKDLSNEQYLNALRDKGIEALKKNQIVESFAYEPETQTTFIYKEHYDIGDIVTVRKKSWGVNLSKRITEIKEVYENGGVRLAIVLGDDIEIDLSQLAN